MYSTFFFAALIGLATGYFASLRGRSPYLWFFIGVFFGMIGMLFLFILPLKKKESLSNVDSELINDIEDKNSLHGKNLWYYLDKGHKQSQAIPFKELKKIWGRGCINSETFVWTDGMIKWKRIREVSSLEKELKF